MNLDEYESIGTHWKTLYVNTENVTYPDSSEVFQRIRKFIGNKNITANIPWIQAYNSVLCIYLWIYWFRFKS